MMKSRQTSFEAYNSIISDGTVQTQQKQIISLLRMYPDGFTRQELKDYLNMNINAVTGRVKELLEKDVLAEDGKKINPNTLKKNLIVKYWRYTK